MRNHLCKMLLSMALNWIGDRTWVPMKEFFYQEIENAGILTVQQAKRHYCLESLFREIKKANEVLVIYKDLPDTCLVCAFDEPNREMPFIDLMQYGNDWIRNQGSRYHLMSYLERKRFEYMRQVVNQRIRLYDLMDDIRRSYIPLYLKRIKLQEIKDIIGVEKYEDIPRILPPVIPPEFIPNLQK